MSLGSYHPKGSNPPANHACRTAVAENRSCPVPVAIRSSRGAESESVEHNGGIPKGKTIDTLAFSQKVRLFNCSSCNNEPDAASTPHLAELVVKTRGTLTANRGCGDDEDPPHEKRKYRGRKRGTPATVWYPTVPTGEFRNSSISPSGILTVHLYPARFSLRRRVDLTRHWSWLSAAPLTFATDAPRQHS
ncbi:hypothetical protein C8R45DRAFT_1067971 [Mycena sanguinolenta]|nr:hypothetical protein C8R45DRAFT_1067971 [Mycena sanguinolenta]